MAGVLFLIKHEIMPYMKTGIFYATSTGTTQKVAGLIAESIGISDSDVHNVSKTAPSVLGRYDLIILGAPTYGAGDLHDEMSDFLDGVRAIDLSGKKAAVFGCGDTSMSLTFCSGVEKMYNALQETGVDMLGTFNTCPYKFEASDAVPVSGAEAIGLLIDDINHADKTADRVKAWVKTLL